MSFIFFNSIEIILSETTLFLLVIIVVLLVFNLGLFFIIPSLEFLNDFRQEVNVEARQTSCFDRDPS